MAPRPDSPGQIVRDEEFIALWHEMGSSPSKVAKFLGIDIKNVYDRRTRVQSRGHDLPSLSRQAGYQRKPWTYPPQIDIQVHDAKVLIGGDLHVWDADPPPVWLAFCEIARRERPDIIILNGDLIDATRISRHPSLRNQNAPRVSDECAALRTWIEMLPDGDYGRYWTIGNHDIRIDRYLANQAPEMAEWAGTLKDVLPDWTVTYSVVANSNTLIRHTFRGGIHAGYNNTMHSGVSTVTNHTHQQDVKSFGDMRGRRYGVETGMLQDPWAPQFEYHENLPTRACAGFALLTYDEDGDLMPPELCSMIGGKAIFRGQPVMKPRVRIQARSESCVL